MAGWYSEDALLRVELDLESAQVPEGFLEVCQQRSTPFRLHQHIVYVDVGVSAELLEEALLHAMLKGGTGISQAKCHGQVTKSSEWGDEGGLQAISWVQLYLVVA